MNKHVVHHAGLCPWGISVGALKKGRKQGSLLIRNTDGAYYSLKPFTAASTEKFVTLHHMGVVLNTLGVPKTSVDWLVAVRKAARGAAYYSIPRSGYHWLWLVRSYLITEMRHCGVGPRRSRRSIGARPAPVAPCMDDDVGRRLAQEVGQDACVLRALGDVVVLHMHLW